MAKGAAIWAACWGVAIAAQVLDCQVEVGIALLVLFAWMRFQLLVWGDRGCVHKEESYLVQGVLYVGPKTWESMKNRAEVRQWRTQAYEGSVPYGSSLLSLTAPTGVSIVMSPMLTAKTGW